TQWLASQKFREFLGLSGGDHAKVWPPECVAHLKTLIESSRDDGPNFELYADELERKFGFKRDRNNIRRFCQANLAELMHDAFPGEPNRRQRPTRRWACACFGELYQHDSTPRHIWGGAGERQSILLSLDDATRKVMACRVCERETVLEHFAMLEESFLRHGLPESIYTDGFSMFGAEGEDLKSQFGRMCRAFGIVHRIAPSPQAKGKIERAMRTFQHRLVVVLRAEGADTPERANDVSARHCDFWNAHHVNEETGSIPDELAARLTAKGRCRLRPAPDPRTLRLYLSQYVARRVESRSRIEFMGRTCPITPTRKQYVWLAVRPLDRGFYVLETKPDPTHPALIPPILGKYRF
ncbi:MAG: transposase family protein, partial [Kiritimatiellae bacterium]|nr:transposase family protein [Kiritimatiellia bacterium]